MADDRRNPVKDDERRTERRRAHETRSLDDVFGDVLPDSTADEGDAGDGESSQERDAALRRDVPPHHR